MRTPKPGNSKMGFLLSLLFPLSSEYTLRYSEAEDRILNRVISGIYVGVGEYTLTISDSKGADNGLPGKSGTVRTAGISFPYLSSIQSV